jgi:hypothetical protein
MSTPNYDALQQQKTGIWKLEKPLTGYKAIKCTCKDTHTDMMHRFNHFVAGLSFKAVHAPPKEETFIAEVTAPKDATVVQPYDENYLRTDEYNLNKILPHKSGLLPNKCRAYYFKNFTYQPGQTYKENQLDINEYNFDGRGLHFFRTPEEAEDYTKDRFGAF